MIEETRLERFSRVAPVSTWALFGAGIALSLMQMCMVMILWLGNWPPELARDQLKYIAVIAIMLALDLMAVIASLARARVSAHGPGGAGFEIGSSGSDAPSAVKVTTEVSK